MTDNWSDNATDASEENEAGLTEDPENSQGAESSIDDYSYS